jgi:hypothetical protein
MKFVLSIATAILFWACVGCDELVELSPPGTLHRSKQHRLLCIEQNPIDIRVIHVPRANLNRRQAAAGREGCKPDAADKIASNGFRNHQFTRSCSITFGDGDIAVCRGVKQVI